MNSKIERLNILALNVGCCIHDGDWNWKNVRSPFSRLYYVSEGSAQIELPSGKYELKPGYMYFIPAYRQHNCICNSHFTHYYIHIFEAFQDGVAMLDELELPVEVPGRSGDLEMMQRLCEINPTLKIPESNPQAYDNHHTLMENYKKNLMRPFSDKVESRGIMYILLSRFLESAVNKMKVDDNRIMKVLSYINKNINKTIDIETLANIACMSKVHFFRTFKEHTGETPNSYLNKKKMERAELYLVATDLPIKSIADYLGYEDHSYFIRIFKKYSGMSPKIYRERSVSAKQD